LRITLETNFVELSLISGEGPRNIFSLRQKVGNYANAEPTILFFRDNSLTLKSKITNEIKQSKINETRKTEVKQNAMNLTHELVIPKGREDEKPPQASRFLSLLS